VGKRRRKPWERTWQKKVWKIAERGEKPRLFQYPSRGGLQREGKNPKRRGDAKNETGEGQAGKC